MTDSELAMLEHREKETWEQYQGLAVKAEELNQQWIRLYNQVVAEKERRRKAELSIKQLQPVEG